MWGDYLVEIVDDGLRKFADTDLIDNLSFWGLKLRDLNVVDDLRGWNLNVVDNLRRRLLGDGDLVDDLRGWKRNFDVVDD
jgi:hypothetical protein